MKWKPQISNSGNSICFNRQQKISDTHHCHCQGRMVGAKGQRYDKTILAGRLDRMKAKEGKDSMAVEQFCFSGWEPWLEKLTIYLWIFF